MPRHHKTARISNGGAFPHRQLALCDEINIMVVDNAGEVHVKEVHAEAVHVEEEVEEELE